MDTSEPELIAGVPDSFLREFEAEILGRVPEEKIKCQLRQEKIARVMHAAGSVMMESLGQKIATIDARLYHRLRLAYAQSPDDTDWIDDMLADEKMLCAPGYRPPKKATRHGITFVNGKPIGYGPHSEKYA